MILAEAAKGGGDFMTMMMFMAPLVLIIFWMMRSSRKREEAAKKRREEMLASIRKTDTVVTLGGIHGDVVSVGEKHIVLRVDGRKDIQLRFERKAIREVLKRAERAEKEG